MDDFQTYPHITMNISWYIELVHTVKSHYIHPIKCHYWKTLWKPMKSPSFMLQSPETPMKPHHVKPYICQLNPIQCPLNHHKPLYRLYQLSNIFPKSQKKSQWIQYEPLIKLPWNHHSWVPFFSLSPQSRSVHRWAPWPWWVAAWPAWPPHGCCVNEAALSGAETGHFAGEILGNLLGKQTLIVIVFIDFFTLYYT